MPHISVELAALGDLGLTPTSPLCSCGMGSPPSAVLCPWPWLLSQSPIPGSTSLILSASSPTTLTPRSPTTPSLPWAWWAVVSWGTAWFGVCLGRRWETCTLYTTLACTSLSPGTNNARLAAMLRQLAQYHAKDPNNLFMVRLAQVMILCSLLVCGRGRLGSLSWGCHPPEGRAGSPRGYSVILSCALSATPGADSSGQGDTHPMPIPQ